MFHFINLEEKIKLDKLSKEFLISGYRLIFTYKSRLIFYKEVGIGEEIIFDQNTDNICRHLKIKIRYIGSFGEKYIPKRSYLR